MSAASLPTIQTLWIGEELTTMERLCAESFIQNGHDFHIYTYGDLRNTPRGIELKDAASIIPPEKIFKYKDHNSYAGFSNIFRYKLLRDRGNVWVDFDVICLRPFDSDADYFFSGVLKEDESRTDDAQVTGMAGQLKTLLGRWSIFLAPSRYQRVGSCVIKAPRNSEIMEYCYRESLKPDPSQLTWGQIGPKLITRAIARFDMWRHVEPPETFAPIKHWDWKNIINGNIDISALQHSRSVHLFNEMWRREGLDKSATFPENSLYEQLKERYL